MLACAGTRCTRGSARRVMPIPSSSDKADVSYYARSSQRIVRIVIDKQSRYAYLQEIFVSRSKVADYHEARWGTVNRGIGLSSDDLRYVERLLALFLIINSDRGTWRGLE